MVFGSFIFQVKCVRAATFLWVVWVLLARGQRPRSQAKIMSANHRNTSGLDSQSGRMKIAPIFCLHLLVQLRQRRGAAVMDYFIGGQAVIQWLSSDWLTIDLSWVSSKQELGSAAHYLHCNGNIYKNRTQFATLFISTIHSELEQFFYFQFAQIFHLSFFWERLLSAFYAMTR